MFILFLFLYLTFSHKFKTANKNVYQANKYICICFSPSPHWKQEISYITSNRFKFLRKNSTERKIFKRKIARKVAVRGYLEKIDPGAPTSFFHCPGHGFGWSEARGTMLSLVTRHTADNAHLFFVVGSGQGVK